MPTYEYVCTSCQNQWEEIQKISEAPVEACPKCAKPTAKRQISGGNFILKGGGWYADLYSSSKPKSESATASGDTKGETKSEAKSEAKTEAKSETKAEPKAEPKASTPASSPPAKSD
jgi:putative FmdB family regulatory protein